jgi:hypothetical protein
MCMPALGGVGTCTLNVGWHNTVYELEGVCMDRYGEAQVTSALHLPLARCLHPEVIVVLTARRAQREGAWDSCPPTHTPSRAPTTMHQSHTTQPVFLPPHGVCSVGKPRQLMQLHPTIEHMVQGPLIS